MLEMREPSLPLREEPNVPNPGWHWRNCRSLGVKAQFWLWPWALGVHREEDVYGGERWVHFGPFSIGLAYSIGNASSEWPIIARTGLGEADAFCRAARWEECR